MGTHSVFCFLSWRPRSVSPEATSPVLPDAFAPLTPGGAGSISMYSRALGPTRRYTFEVGPFLDKAMSQLYHARQQVLHL